MNNMSTPASDNDRLVEIPYAEWPLLRDMYRRDWPANLIGCYTVDTFLRWIEKSTSDAPIKHLAIYSLNGEWSDDGTYVCVHRYQVFANTLNPVLDRLHRALQLLPNWSNGYLVSTLYSRFRSAVQQCSIEFESVTRLYYMPKERAMLFNITPPPGIHLRSLTVEHAQIVNDLWPHRHQGSLFFIEQIIARSPSIGAFTDDGQLVAWCIRWQAGPHGALQVLDTHLRRGLGMLVMKAFARKLSEMGLDSYACVLPDNGPSTGLFEKAGFEVIDDVYWMPNIAKINWSD